jgi:uncharacterized protein YqgV (UPF0045/DUF77 family)
LAKVVLNTIGSRYGSIDALNANFAAIEEAFENTLSRDGEGPNALEANLDAGSFRIINLPVPVGESDAATKAYVDEVTSILSEYVEQIDIVADNIEAVIAVSEAAEFIAANQDAITLVAENIDNVNDVADNSGNIELVALELNGAFQQGVVYDFGSITEAPIGEVDESTSSIVTVAENIENVIIVGSNMSDINTVVDNLDAILNADEEALAAAASAADALGYKEDAAASALAAATSETNAQLAESNAQGHEAAAEAAKDDAIVAQLAAESALASTLAAYDNFDDRYLGAKAEDPTTDNDGDPLVGGALYFQTGAGMKVWTGATWEFAYVPGGIYLAKANNLSELTNLTTARSNLGLGALAVLNAVGSTEITNNAVTTEKLAATLDYGSIV